MKYRVQIGYLLPGCTNTPPTRGPPGAVSRILRGRSRRRRSPLLSRCDRKRITRRLLMTPARRAPKLRMRPPVLPKMLMKPVRSKLLVRTHAAVHPSPHPPTSPQIRVHVKQARSSRRRSPLLARPRCAWTRHRRRAIARFLARARFNKCKSSHGPYPRTRLTVAAASRLDMTAMATTCSMPRS